MNINYDEVALEFFEQRLEDYRNLLNNTAFDSQLTDIVKSKISKLENFLKQNK